VSFPESGVVEDNMPVVVYFGVIDVYPAVPDHSAVFVFLCGKNHGCVESLPVQKAAENNRVNKAGVVESDFISKPEAKTDAIPDPFHIPWFSAYARIGKFQQSAVWRKEVCAKICEKGPQECGCITHIIPDSPDCMAKGHV